jgi:hypothetical protein
MLLGCFRGNVDTRNNDLFLKVMNARIEYSLTRTARISVQQLCHALNELLGFPFWPDTV